MKNIFIITCTLFFLFGTRAVAQSRIYFFPSPVLYHEVGGEKYLNTTENWGAGPKLVQAKSLSAVIGFERRDSVFYKLRFSRTSSYFSNSLNSYFSRNYPDINDYETRVDNHYDVALEGILDRTKWLKNYKVLNLGHGSQLQFKYYINRSIKSIRFENPNIQNLYLERAQPFSFGYGKYVSALFKTPFEKANLAIEAKVGVVADIPVTSKVYHREHNGLVSEMNLHRVIEPVRFGVMAQLTLWTVFRIKK